MYFMIQKLSLCPLAFVLTACVYFKENIHVVLIKACFQFWHFIYNFLHGNLKEKPTLIISIHILCCDYLIPSIIP